MINFTIAISSYNRVDCLKKCLESVQKSLEKCKDYEILIVDNSSRKDVKDYINNLSPEIKVHHNLPVSGGLIENDNKKFELASGKYVYHCVDNYLIENPKRRDWLQDIKDVFDDEEDGRIAVVSNELSTSRVVCPDGKISWSHVPKKDIKEFKYAILGTPHNFAYPTVGYTYKKESFNVVGRFETESNNLIEYNHIWQFIRKKFYFAIISGSATTKQIVRMQNGRNF